MKFSAPLITLFFLSSLSFSFSAFASKGAASQVAQFEGKFKKARVEVINGQNRKIYYVQWPKEVRISEESNFDKKHTQNLQGRNKTFFLKALNDVYAERGDNDITTCPRAYVRVIFEKEKRRETKVGCISSTSLVARKAKRLVNIIGML